MLRVLNDIFFQGNFKAEERDLTGKHIALTGPTVGGIGFETACTLAGFGATVILGARNLTKGEAAKEAIKERFPNAPEVKVIHCDTSDLDSVRHFAAAVDKPLDVLVCNAGVINEEYQTVEIGGKQVEKTFAVCAVGHHLMAQLIAPKRVVWVTGDIYVMAKGPADPFYAYKKGGGQDAYNRASLGRMLLGWELQKRSEGKIEVVMVQPGVIASNLVGAGPMAKWVMGSIFINVTLGAQASIHSATVPSNELPGDASTLRYFSNKQKWVTLKSTDMAMDADKAKALFDQCNELCGL